MTAPLYGTYQVTSIDPIWSRRRIFCASPKRVFRDPLNKEMTDSVPGDAVGQTILSLGIWRNRGEVAQIVVFAAVGDGFQVFRISPMGNADTGNLALLCHVYRLLLLYNKGFVK